MRNSAVHGSELSEIQNALGFTRREMAAAMGVHYQTLTKWLLDERTPDNAALQLARLLLWLHRRGMLDDWMEDAANDD